jgi:F-type H+-transporting ATPase subunit epsilon
VAPEELPIITVEMTSPGSQPLTLEATEVIVPGRSGIFSIRSGHTPMLSTLRSGVLIVTTPDGTDTFFAVHEGFAEVLDNTVRILTPQFERGEHIDIDRAEQARERAELLLSKKDADLDIVRAETALHRSLARIGAHRGESI